MSVDMGELFAGIGGFGLAFTLAGFNVTWQAEIEPKACLVLARRFPNAHNYGDIHNVTEKKISPAHWHSTPLICGGSPCQDISIASATREGLAGSQSGLFYEFARVARDSNAAWFVFENVAGLLTSNEGKDFALVIGFFTGTIPEIPKSGWRSAGIAWGEKYKIAWRVLDSQYDGVAQQRRRIFIVGHREDIGRPVEVLLDEKEIKWSPPTRRATWQVTQNPLECGFHSPTQEGGVTAYRMQFNDVNGTRKDRPNGGLYVYETDTVGTVTEGGGAGDTVIVVPAITRKLAKGTGGPSGDEVGHVIVQDDDLRDLMPEEVELLQGFPEGWTAGHSDHARYSMLGNAVNVSTVYWIALRIRFVMKKYGEWQ